MHIAAFVPGFLRLFLHRAILLCLLLCLAFGIPASIVAFMGGYFYSLKTDSLVLFFSATCRLSIAIAWVVSAVEFYGNRIDKPVPFWFILSVTALITILDTVMLRFLSVHVYPVATILAFLWLNLLGWTHREQIFQRHRAKQQTRQTPDAEEERTVIIAGAFERKHAGALSLRIILAQVRRLLAIRWEKNVYFSRLVIVPFVLLFAFIFLIWGPYVLLPLAATEFWKWFSSGPNHLLFSAIVHFLLALPGLLGVPLIICYCVKMSTKTERKQRRT